MRIYLDICCFNRPYDDQSSERIELETQAKLHVQRMIRKGRLQLATSYVLFYENQHNPHVMRRTRILHFLKKYGSVYIGSGQAERIGQVAAPIIATGVKLQDAHHVACALEAGCRYFLTTDDRLLKYKNAAISLLNPVDFILLEAEDHDYGHS